ncbi:MAG: hypothetical protein ACM3U2_00970 [Deltaproteobacteria bacterium]
MKWPQRSQSLGMLLLAIWLIVSGATAFVHLGSFNLGPLLAALAIAAGVLILLGR